MIVGIISIIVLTAFAPSLTAVDTKPKGEEFVNINKTSTIKGGLIDNVHIQIYSIPFIFTFPWWGYACNIDYVHRNDEPIECIYYLNITTRDGTQLFETETYYEKNLKPNFMSSINYYHAKSYRDEGYPFGLFNVKVDFYVLTDGSSKQVTFHGFIYFINAIYFDSWKDW